VDEAEWWTCNDPEPMLEFVRGKLSERKRRLFACACCRRIEHLLTKDVRKALRAAEKFADGLLGPEELQQENEHVARASRGRAERWRIQDQRERTLTAAAVWLTSQDEQAVRMTARETAESVAVLRVEECAGGRSVNVWVKEAGPVVHYRREADGKVAKEREREWEAQIQQACANAWWAERSAQAELLRCIAGPPSRSFDLSADWPRWEGGVVVRIAESLYCERLSEDLPILADALEDAGCDNADILSHCRSSGPHVRGCWVIDLLLGKE